MIKIDLQKAYVQYNVFFVKYLMLELGFPNMYVNWIMACLCLVSYTFKVNGELTLPIAAKKGLRQEDPVSAYLFVLCIEVP